MTPYKAKCGYRATYESIDTFEEAKLTCMQDDECASVEDPGCARKSFKLCKLFSGYQDDDNTCSYLKSHVFLKRHSELFLDVCKCYRSAF